MKLPVIKRCGVLAALLLALSLTALASTRAISLRPASDVAKAHIVGYPDSEHLFANLATDGVASYIQREGDASFSSLDIGYSNAPAGEVTQAVVTYHANQFHAHGTVQVKLYDGPTLIGTGATHDLESNDTTYSDTFANLHVPHGNNLHTIVEFRDKAASPSGALRCSALRLEIAIGPPFVMFAAVVPELRPMLERYLTSADYISAGIADMDSVLASHIPASHQFALPTSIHNTSGTTQLAKNSVATWIDHSNAAGTPGLILYDGEHWPGTPESEQRDPVTSIQKAASLVHGNRTALIFGVAPDGQFIGLPAKSCKHDLTSSIYRSVDWTQVDVLDIQAQRDLSDQCGGIHNLPDYVAWIRSVAQYVRSKNHNIVVVAQMSFRHTSPETMLAAMEQLTDLADGFYLAFPIHVAGENGGPAPPCSYCKADAVIRVLGSTVLER